MLPSVVEPLWLHEQVPMADILEAARQHGIESLTEVRLAVLEPSGRISFITCEAGDG